MKKNKTIQVRITSEEKVLLDKLREMDKEITISRLVRESLHKHCEEKGLLDSGVGNFQIG